MIAVFSITLIKTNKYNDQSAYGQEKPKREAGYTICLTNFYISARQPNMDLRKPTFYGYYCSYKKKGNGHFGSVPLCQTCILTVWF